MSIFYDSLIDVVCSCRCGKNQTEKNNCKCNSRSKFDKNIFKIGGKIPKYRQKIGEVIKYSGGICEDFEETIIINSIETDATNLDGTTPAVSPILTNQIVDDCTFNVLVGSDVIGLTNSDQFIINAKISLSDGCVLISSIIVTLVDNFGKSQTIDNEIEDTQNLPPIETQTFSNSVNQNQDSLISSYQVNNTNTINSLQNIPSNAVRANVIITQGEIEFSALGVIEPDGVSDAINGEIICLSQSELVDFTIIGVGGNSIYSFTVEYFDN